MTIFVMPPTGFTQPSQLVDDLVEPLALDQLHDVERELALTPDLEDRHDVGVVHPCRRLGLAAEPLQGPAVAHYAFGQDFQGHTAAQADLLGLVDGPHAAPAELAEDPVVAQSTEPALDRIPAGRRRLGVDRKVLLDHHQSRKQLPDLVG